MTLIKQQVKIQPKVSISKLMGTIKGRTALQIFRQFPYLEQEPYWGNHFGYVTVNCGVLK